MANAALGAASNPTISVWLRAAGCGARAPLVGGRAFQNDLRPSLDTHLRLNTESAKILIAGCPRWTSHLEHETLRTDYFRIIGLAALFGGAVLIAYLVGEFSLRLSLAVTALFPVLGFSVTW